LAHYKTVLTEIISGGSYLTDAQALKALISADVTADTNKCSYQSVSCYPNPTNGNLTIQNNQFEIEKVKNFNLQGKLLFTTTYQNTKLLNLDFSNYTNGIYLVILYTKKNIKIIKN
jgi:hypothetical protein